MNTTAGRETLFVTTPFTQQARQHNTTGVWGEWGPYALPEIFAGVARELWALRNTAMLEDKTPLVKYRIRGTDAERFVDLLITRDASRIEVNHAYYTPWCDHRGKVVVEGLLFRLADDQFCYTSSEMRNWFQQHREPFDVDVEDVTHEFGILALQGPNSLAVLEDATGATWADLRFSRGRAASIASHDVHVWRTGFTGVKGYELWVPWEAGNDVWGALMAAGKRHELHPCGYIVQDIARIEAGIVLPEIDYARAGPDSYAVAHGYGLAGDRYLASPFELDMGRFVDLNKSDFIGMGALRAESEQSSGTRRLMGVVVDWRSIASASLEMGELPAFPQRTIRYPPLDLLHDGSEIGFATSVAWSPTLKSMIGFAHVPVELAQPGLATRINYPYAGDTIETGARLCGLPFIDHTRV